MRGLDPIIAKFFDWLNYGDGCAIALPKCERPYFDIKRYKKLAPIERTNFGIQLEINETMSFVKYSSLSTVLTTTYMCSMKRSVSIMLRSLR